jgi:hypothetical protein
MSVTIVVHDAPRAGGGAVVVLARRACPREEARRLTIADLRLAPVMASPDPGRLVAAEASGRAWSSTETLGEFDARHDNQMHIDGAVLIFIAYPADAVLIRRCEYGLPVNSRGTVWRPSTRQMEQRAVDCASGPLCKLPEGATVRLHPLSMPHRGVHASVRVQTPGSRSLALEVAAMHQSAGHITLPVLTIEFSRRLPPANACRVAEILALLSAVCLLAVIGLMLVTIDPCLAPWQPRCDVLPDIPAYCR